MLRRAIFKMSLPYIQDCLNEHIFCKMSTAPKKMGRRFYKKMLVPAK